MATKANPNVTDIIAATGIELLTDDDTLNFFAHDVFERGAALLAVVRPKNKEELAAAVAAAGAAAPGPAGFRASKFTPGADWAASVAVNSCIGSEPP